MTTDEKFLIEVTDGRENALEYAKNIVDMAPGAGALPGDWTRWREMTYWRVRKIIELSWRDYEERRQRDLRDVR